MHNQNYHKIDEYIAIKKVILSHQSLFGIKVMSDSMKLHNHEIITKKKKNSQNPKFPMTIQYLLKRISTLLNYEIKVTILYIKQ